MKNRTLRVAIENSLSEEKQIENDVVQVAVLSVMLFLVAMAKITHGIEEPIKIIGYADAWIIHTPHKHERVSVVKLQKAMDKIVKWVDDTGFQISIEKTKAIMFSRKNTAIAPRPRLDKWIKGTKLDKRKTRTRTTRKMGKLDHNHERTHTTPHYEHQHQNDDQTRAGCHKPLTH
jgi:hypothetical protein